MHRFKWVNEKTNTDKDVLNVQSDQYTELSSRISSQLFLNHLRINWLLQWRHCGHSGKITKDDAKIIFHMQLSCETYNP